MAVVPSDYQGRFVGRVGSVVGYVWKNRACIRAYRRSIAYPNTEGQQLQRSWFVSMVRFASQATPALKLGLRHLAEEHQMTEGNYFVLTNKSHFVRENGAVSIAYDKLLISSGPAADVFFRNPRFGEDQVVSVEFEKNAMALRASGEDRVYLYVYSPTLGMGLLSGGATRRSKSIRIRLPESWSGHQVHLYGFVVDRDGRASNSTYIGTGRVDYYEDHDQDIMQNKSWKDFVDMANRANGVSADVDSPDRAVRRSASSSEGRAGVVDDEVFPQKVPL